MLIALHSRGRQAGKDTAGKIIQSWCEHKDRAFERRAFADPMKILVAGALGHSSVDEGDYARAVEVVDELKLVGHVGWTANGRVPAPPFIQGRDFIINLSETAKKLWGPDFWVNQTLPDGDSWMAGSANHVCVITDLRFDQEAERVRKRGGVVVQVVRPGAELGRSEQGIRPGYIDHILYNTQDLPTWETRVLEFMERLAKDHDRMLPTPRT